jgi:hypothetical protein
VSQVVEQLSSKYEAPTSNPSNIYNELSKHFEDLRKLIQRLKMPVNFLPQSRIVTIFFKKNLLTFLVLSGNQEKNKVGKY